MTRKKKSTAPAQTPTTHVPGSMPPDPVDTTMHDVPQSATTQRRNLIINLIDRFLDEEPAQGILETLINISDDAPNDSPMLPIFGLLVEWIDYAPLLALGPQCERPHNPPCNLPHNPACDLPHNPPCTLAHNPPCELAHNPPCTLPHNPPCTLPHNAPCTLPHDVACTRPHDAVCDKPHAEPCRLQHYKAIPPTCPKPHFEKCTRAHMDEQAPGGTAVKTAPPVFPAKAFTAIAAKKVITPAHINAAVDLHSKIQGLSATEALRIATETAQRIPQPQPKTRSPPRNATKTIFVSYAKLTREQLDRLPAPTILADEFNKRTAVGVDTLATDWCRLKHTPTCPAGTHKIHFPALSHVEIHPASVRFVFIGSLPSDVMDDSHRLLTSLCTTIVSHSLAPIDPLIAAQTSADTYRFKSCVVFSNVLSTDASGRTLTNKDHANAIRAAPAWGDVNITRVNYWRPPKAGDQSTGCLFVDFQDDARSSTLHRLTRARVRMGTDFLSCHPAKPSAQARATPRCDNCQRWNHRTEQCTSRFANCERCGGAHTTAQHKDVARGAPAKCFNCGEKHGASSKSCEFYERRMDRYWLFCNRPTFDRVTKAWVYVAKRRRAKA
ncbi:hypothetical protein PENSPDRAFT_13005 [Peniophora sp. CONT]|nr:hypothetical protein PENSPDRAFT_13005 [Peniophora sp. CONT]